MTLENKAEMAPLEILYQDEHCVAIHKPSGLLVHKSDIDKYDSNNAMQLLRDQINQWVYPVHRLDKPTSGVLLFTLSSDAARLLEQQFSNREIKKEYIAIVRGYMNEDGIINHPLKPIANFKQDRKQVAQKAPQSATTSYRCLGHLEFPIHVDKYPSSRYSLVKLFPETGRKHQLRRHLKHIHHPIIGDPKYGKSKHNAFFSSELGCNRLLLASTALTFTHPHLQTTITIRAELNGHFARIADAFKKNDYNNETPSINTDTV